MSRLLRFTLRSCAYFCGTFTALGGVGTAICYYDFHRQYERPHSWSTKPIHHSLEDVLNNTSADPFSTTLSQEQIEQFHRDGYVVARNVIPVSYIQAMRVEALAYAQKYRGSLYPFDKYSGRNAIHRPSLHANWACHLAQNLGHIGIGQLASSLYNNDGIHLAFDTLDYILPKQKTAWAAPIRKETSGHRDGVRAWVPLEDITRNNSPPIVIPGSHRWCEECFMGHGPCALCFGSSLRDTPKCPNNNELLNNIEKWNTIVLDDLKEGDVVFIDPKALHSTGGPNNTQTPRLGLRLHLKTATALNDYMRSDRYSKVQTKRGWTTMLLRGWSPSHPRVLDDVTAPQIWPLMDNKARFEGSWPREEPSFSDCIIFALGSASRWLVWYAIGSRQVLEPPQSVVDDSNTLAPGAEMMVQ